MFGSRDRKELSPYELGLDPKLNLEPLNYLSHSFVYLVSLYCISIQLLPCSCTHDGLNQSVCKQSYMHLQFLQPPTLAKTLLAALRRTPGS